MKFSAHFCQLFFIVLVVSGFNPALANTVYWEDIGVPSDSGSKLSSKQLFVTETYEKARLLTLDEEKIKSFLDSSAKENQGISAKQISAVTENPAKKITIPLPNRKNINVSIKFEELLPKVLASKFPQIKTYRVLPDDQVISGRLDFTYQGFHGMLQLKTGEIIIIDPVSKNSTNEQSRTYVSYRKKDQHAKGAQAFSCGVVSNSKFSDLNSVSSLAAQRPLLSAAAPEKSLLHYRIAVAASGEYTAKHGGTIEGAMSAIVTTLNRVNQVFENDLGIHLGLVANNDQLIYTNAGSDPYNASNTEGLTYQNQENIDTVIGSENYDLGHLFTASGGGLAAIASVCNQHEKALGVSGISNSQDDRFDLDFVAHEIGHQLGATHTFNSTQGLCSGGTRTARTAFEPGSGSTIMSYAGYCGLDNLQSNVDPMFHIGSIQQIDDFVSRGRGNSCGTRENLANNPPQANAGKDYVIPANTPFELLGSATDADGDSLVYTWEQMDTGESSPEYSDKGNNALFRVHLPSIKENQYFPPLENILHHIDGKGETLPIHQRSLRFGFVAQDGFNAAQSDEMTVNVIRTGSRFALNLPRSQYTVGETYEVFWNVANTDKSPINCQSVDITLSTDGGKSFNQNLGKNIANTGKTWITFPANTPLSNRARLKIKCSNNIFLALSYRDFVITDQTQKVTFKYDDEDQPESNLQDKNLNGTPLVSNISDDSSSAQGGGSLGVELILLLIPLFYRKKMQNKFKSELYAFFRS